MPLTEISARDAARLELRVSLRSGEAEVERHPEVAPIRISLEVTR